jgi:hypothetical protein
LGRYFAIVLAFVGDSTMTRALEGRDTIILRWVLDAPRGELWGRHK